VIGLELGSVIAFAVVTETIFSWPGVGKLIIDSINALDRPVMVAYLMLVAFLFIMGLKAGAPVVVALLLGTVAFGLVARTVPQMNIFVVSMPVNIAVGLLFFGLSLPHLAAYMGDLFAGMPRNALFLLKALH